jgi:DNA-directed RNA polymerase specialized sigma24 family protein
MAIHNAPNPISSGTHPGLSPRKAPRYLPLSEEEEGLIPKLSPPHQEVLRVDGSMEDRAAQLKVPVGTLKSRLHRARKALAALSRGVNQGH